MIQTLENIIAHTFGKKMEDLTMGLELRYDVKRKILTFSWRNKEFAVFIRVIKDPEVGEIFEIVSWNNFLNPEVVTNTILNDATRDLLRLKAKTFFDVVSLLKVLMLTQHLNGKTHN